MSSEGYNAVYDDGPPPETLVSPQFAPARRIKRDRRPPLPMMDNQLTLNDLAEAIKENNYDKLKKQLEEFKGVGKNNVNLDAFFNNDSLLMTALKTRCEETSSENMQTNEKIICLLLEKDEGINVQNPRGETPFEFVKKCLLENRQHWVSILELFEQHQAKLSTIETINETFVANPDNDRTTFPPKFACLGDMAGFHGRMFQLKLVMIALNRGIKLCSDLFLASEMEKAEKFDDVVVRYKLQNETKWNWYFLQAKHKLDTNESLVTEYELFKKTDGYYSLAKYFVSFCKIMENPYFQKDVVDEIVLCTNTSFAYDAEIYFESTSNLEKDNFLQFSQTQRYRFNLKRTFDAIKEFFVNQEVKEMCKLNIQIIDNKKDNLAFRKFLEEIQKEIKKEEEKLKQQFGKLKKIKKNIPMAKNFDQIKKELKKDVILGKISDKFITSIKEEKHFSQQDDNSLSNFKKELENEIDDIIKENENIQNALTNISIDHLEKFFTKLRFICNCPDDAELNTIISSELGEQFGLLNAELVTHSFEHKILDWYQECHDGKSRYLRIADGEKMLRLIEDRIISLTANGLSLAHVEKLKLSGVSYKEIPNELELFLSEDKVLYNSLFILTESPLLSAIKTVQVLEKDPKISKKKDSFIFIKSEDLLSETMQLIANVAFKSAKCHNYIVIEFERNLPKVSETVLLEILNILQHNSDKKVIFIFHEQDQTVQYMKTLFKNYQLFNDINISFKHLDIPSQEEILKLTITFQNQKISMNNLINRKSACDVIDVECLLKLLKYEEITIGSGDLPQFPSYYIKRKIEKKNFTEEKYTALGTKNSLHGEMYQLKLVMLFLNRFLNRGMKLYSDFFLASEMEKAEKFDDIVLRYKKQNETKWSWRFIQAKHKLDTNESLVTEQELFKKTGGDYSLAKYFISFCKIKESPYFQKDLDEIVLAKKYKFNLESIFDRIKDFFFNQEVKNICELKLEKIADNEENVAIKKFLEVVQKEIKKNLNKLGQDMVKLKNIQENLFQAEHVGKIKKELEKDVILGTISDEFITRMLIEEKHFFQNDGNSFSYFKKELENKINDILKEKANIQKSVSSICIDNLKEFFTKLGLIGGCPDDAEIKIIIPNKLGELIGLVDGEVLKHRNTLSDPVSEKYFANLVNTFEKLYIVANDAGIGKSYFLSSLAHQIRQRHENSWVFRINLNNYAYSQSQHLGEITNKQSLENICFSGTETDRAIDFITNMLLSKESNFSRSLFKLSLKKSSNSLNVFPKIVLLFDGFDEISPTFKDKTLTLFEALKNSNFALMCIATRFHEQASLESGLKATTLVLQAPTKEQKIKFLNRLWKHKIQFFKEENCEKAYKQIIKYLQKLDDPCNKLLNKNMISKIRQDFQNPWPCTDTMEQSLIILRNSVQSLDFTKLADNAISQWEKTANNDWEEFTNIPLNLKMYGDIMFLEHLKSIDVKDLPKMYDRFIETKFNYYYKNIAGVRTVSGNDMRQRDEKSLKQIHQNIAYKLFFPKKSMYKIKEEDKVTLVRVGLLKYNENEDLVFIHRTYAEYFLAQYLTQFENKDVFEILCKDILFNIHEYVFPCKNIEVFVENQVFYPIFDPLRFSDIKYKIRPEEIFYLLNFFNFLNSDLIKIEISSFNTEGSHAVLDNSCEYLITILKFVLCSKGLFESLLEHIIVRESSDFDINDPILHLWAKYCDYNNNKIVLDLIYEYEIAKIQLNKKETNREIADLIWKNIVSIANDYGDTVLHILSKKGEFAAIQEFLSWVKLTVIPSIIKLSRNQVDEDICNNDMVNFLLLKLNIYEQNFLNVAKRLDNKISLVNLTDYIGIHIGAEILNTLSKNIDLYDNTFLQNAYSFERTEYSMKFLSF